MKKNDLILTGIVLLVALLAFFSWRLFFHGEGGKAVVSVDGQVVKELPLDKDTEYLITTSDGETNLLVIEGGEAYVREASCPDTVCVRTGKIKNEGEMIVCLPHKLIITIEAGE